MNIDNDEQLREQLEEFALHLKPGTTKGKHRTAIFDTLELTKLVRALLAAQRQALRDEVMNVIGEDETLEDHEPTCDRQHYDVPCHCDTSKNYVRNYFRQELRTAISTIFDSKENKTV